MAARRKERSRVLRKLRSKYRLLLIDERSFEERFSLRLSRLNVILVAIAAIILVSALVTGLIVLTPLKTFIPGYSDQDLKLYAYRSTLKADSLAAVVHVRDQYINDLRSILRGEVPVDSVAGFRPVVELPTAADLRPSQVDSALRARVAREEAYTLAAEPRRSTDRRELAGVFFFPPLRGIVTSRFDPAIGHFGVDVVARADEPVKACLDGTVILASWTNDGGHVMHVQHRNDLISVYKHNAVLLKKVGDRVRAGEAIAVVGDSGELSDGPHLHFELWQGGEPMDPQAYMVFE
jgi:murein DD-endopeptidase MepM/ murein hydrolase activator NlpD